MNGFPFALLPFSGLSQRCEIGGYLDSIVFHVVQCGYVCLRYVIAVLKVESLLFLAMMLFLT